MAKTKKAATAKRKARHAIAKAAAKVAAELAELGAAEAAAAEAAISNAPALPDRHGEKPQKASDALLKLGEPPKDLLAAQEWFYKVLVTSAHDTLIDADISNKERRRELRSIGASAAALFPDAVRAEAVRIIKEDADRLKARARSRGGAKLEDIPPATAEDGANGATIQ